MPLEHILKTGHKNIYRKGNYCSSKCLSVYCMSADMNFHEVTNNNWLLQKEQTHLVREKQHLLLIASLIQRCLSIHQNREHSWCCGSHSWAPILPSIQNVEGMDGMRQIRLNGTKLCIYMVSYLYDRWSVPHMTHDIQSCTATVAYNMSSIRFFHSIHFIILIKAK